MTHAPVDDNMTQARTRRRRAAIVEAAELLFLDRGYAATSMAAISEAAGGSKQSLYNHFPSKAALFAAIMAGQDCAELEATPGLLESSPFADGLAAFCLDYLTAATRERALAFRRLTIEAGREVDRAWTAVQVGRRLCWSRVVAPLERARSQGRLRDKDPRLMATHLQGLVEAGYYQDRLDGGPADDEALAQAARAAAQAFVAAYVGA